MCYLRRGTQRFKTAAPINRYVDESRATFHH